MFFKFGDTLHNTNTVDFFKFYMKGNVRYQDIYPTKTFVARIYWIGHTDANPQWSEEYGQAAIDLAMRLGPHVLEGSSEFKFARHTWAFHNLIAHPLMQICAFLGLTKLGLKIHDSTIPKPKILT